MKYSNETIRKYLTSARAKIAEYRANIENAHVCISKGNRKIGCTMNVSISPIITCANCHACLHDCYDIKANIQYGNVLNARTRNTALFLEDPARYFAEIEEAINRRRRNKVFRWHVAGDIVNYSYFENMVAIARRHPDFVFWTYTKNYTIVNRWLSQNGGKLPANLSVMFSKWAGVEMPNPYGMPTFEAIPEEETREEFHCPGNCDVCLTEKRGCPYAESAWVYLH